MVDLSPTEQKFILHWGEMGGKWGVNRTIAQIHALLYISPKPLNAEEIASTLSIARSNVSTSIKDLQGWGIIKTVPVLGDRREHYESLKDVWDMFKIVLEERKRREVDPTMAMLRECVADAKTDRETDAYTKERLESLLEFFELMSGAYKQVSALPCDLVIKLLKMENRLEKLLAMLGK